MIQIRNNCFETNSSSSHSVCISMDSEIDPEIYNLIKNDTLYIFRRDDGFTDDMKTNKCLDKLQYLVFLVCRDFTTIHGSKVIKQFRTRLKNAFGVSNVYIGNVDEYYNALRERKGKPFDSYTDKLNFLASNLSHLINTSLNSFIDSIIEEVFESRETLRSFILSPNSWLYIMDKQPYTSFDDYYKFKKEIYSISEKRINSICTVKYSDDLSIDSNINLFNCFPVLYTVSDIFQNVLTDCRNITIDNNKLVYSSNNRVKYFIKIIGDKYNLIRVTFTDDNFCCDWSDGLVGEKIYDPNEPIDRFTSYSIDEFKAPDNMKEYKTFPIDIMSSDILGDLIL